MVSGRRKAPRPERRLRLPSAAARAAAALVAGALLAAMILASCGPFSERQRASAFTSSLSAIDALLGAPPGPARDRAFAKASSLARASSDWLSILKRARRADSGGSVGLYAKTADRARKAFPGSEPLAAAAAHAYLRGGRPAEALALFRGSLSPDTRSGLWTEAFLASREAETGGPAGGPPAGLPPATASDYGRYAQFSGDARAYLGAAATVFSDGGAEGGVHPSERQLAARAWLERALAGGAHAPFGLLWDCGLFEVLASAPDLGSGAAELALAGDAAWMAGDAPLATRRWERSISLAPRLSWKPYVKLALMAGRGEASSSYWARLKAAFLLGPPSRQRDGALEAYAAHLARQGGEAEALALLKGSAAGSPERSGSLEMLEASIRGRSQPEGRFAVELESLAASRPGDPLVLGAVLRALFLRASYGELSIVREAAARGRVPLAYGWFYDAALLAARGDLPAASAAVLAAGGTAGAAGDFALGSLYAAMGRPRDAAAAYARAAGSTSPGPERCAAYKGLGRALGEAGDSGGAALAFKQAAAADPADVEASILGRGSTPGVGGQTAHDN
jgi:tetratricopeptide (TPR) repeat protein